MGEKKTRLVITGRCDRRKIYVTKDFKNLDEAYKFLGTFESEENLTEFIYDYIGKTIKNFKLEKERYKEPNINYKLMFKRDLELCSVGNLKAVLTCSSYNSSFIDKLIADKYCKAVLDRKNSYNEPMDEETYKFKYFRGHNFVNKYRPSIAELQRAEKNIVNFIDEVLYDSKNNLNKTALRYLFSKYVKESDYKYLGVHNIETLTELESYYSLNKDLLSLTETSCEEKKDNKEYYGDGNILNPNYERTIIVRRLLDGTFCIEDDDEVYFITLKQALEKYAKDLDMLREIKTAAGMTEPNKSLVRSK